MPCLLHTRGLRSRLEGLLNDLKIDTGCDALRIRATDRQELCTCSQPGQLGVDTPMDALAQDLERSLHLDSASPLQPAARLPASAEARIARFQNDVFCSADGTSSLCVRAAACSALPRLLAQHVQRALNKAPASAKGKKAAKRAATKVVIIGARKAPRAPGRVSFKMLDMVAEKLGDVEDDVRQRKVLSRRRAKAFRKLSQGRHKPGSHSSPATASSRSKRKGRKVKRGGCTSQCAVTELQM